jgi:Eco29kI restriction endonuclease
VTKRPYNPLHKINLARSIKEQLLSSDVRSLSVEERIAGAGVYVIYYVGDFTPYSPISSQNRRDKFECPIYVGKAIPKGGRKGGLTKDSKIGSALNDRLRDHASSIDEVANLQLADFHFRHLVVEDIWIPLGENMLIETFKPIWNRAIDGYGNKAPGRRRTTQYKSPWDVLHPGRKSMMGLADSGLTSEFLVQRVKDYLAGRPLASYRKRLPRSKRRKSAKPRKAPTIRYSNCPSFDS